MQSLPQNQFIQKCAITLTPETSVEFAVQLMNQTNTSYVLILEQSQIVGIFTERELISAIASGIKLSVATLLDVMAYNVITIKESELGDLFSIIRLLHQHQISYLPVLDEQEQLLGVVTNQSIQQALPPELERSVQLAQTQRQHTEEALRESEERLQLALEASGDGLWDWKISTAGVLQAQPETAQQMLDIAYSDTERLVRLVNDILDLEHLESNKFTILKQWCDTATILRQSVEAVQPLATEHQIKLVILPNSVQISVDPDRIMQTLVNLIGNAIKFSLANSTVTLSVEDLSDRVLFKVQDQGKGIPENMLENIFGRFQQVDASDSRQKGGTGLGLAICRGIVQQHGGKIWAESVLGEGSIFYFTIPKSTDS